MSDSNRRTGLGDGLRQRAKMPKSSIEEAWARPRYQAQGKKKKAKRTYTSQLKKIPVSAIKNQISKSVKKSVKKVAVAKSQKPTVRSRSSRSASKHKLVKFLQERKRSFALVAIILIMPFMFIALTRLLFEKHGKPQALGDKKDQSSVATSPLQEIDNPEFNLLLPTGKKSDIKIVKVSPEGNDATYAFVDQLEGADIRVSEQKMPESFKKDNVETKLKELADSFQATNVIQINEEKIYHGFSEKAKTQSLIFVKNGLLIFIASSQQLEDSVWVGYITGLQ